MIVEKLLMCSERLLVLSSFGLMAYGTVQWAGQVQAFVLQNPLVEWLADPTLAALLELVS